MITTTSISTRENQVLVLLAQGLTVKEVANELPALQTMLPQTEQLTVVRVSLTSNPY